MSPDIRESKGALDSGFQAVDSGFQVLDSAIRILDSFFRGTWISDSNCSWDPGARFSKVPVTLRARNQIFKSKYKE